MVVFHGFCLKEILQRGGFHLRNINSDFMDLLFLRSRLVNPKKKRLQSSSREQWYMMRQQWVCEIRPPRRNISVRSNLFYDSRFYWEIRNFKFGFPNRKHPMFTLSGWGKNRTKLFGFIRLISILEVRINVCHQWKIKKIQKEWNQIINIWQKCSNGNQNAISKLFAQIKV